jgi:hypothetical protein
MGELDSRAALLVRALFALTVPPVGDEVPGGLPQTLQ